MGYRSYWNYYEPTRPIEVKGGIKSQSRSGGFGESWWAQRWIDVLESFHMGARLGRGKTYARKGQVLSITIDKGLITAEVQGSRPKPYKVEMKIKTLSESVKKKLLKEIGESILFAVKLHSGEMPKELEETFLSAGLPLFPQKYSEMNTDCSCPDWSDPCKHIAAVCYLLAEEFDRDPFLIVKLRGLDRDELISASGRAGADAGSPGSTLFQEQEGPREERVIPLSSDNSAFWGSAEGTGAFTFNTAAPSIHAHTVRRLGKFPFWRGAGNLIDMMDSVYRTATVSALETLAGREREESRSDDEQPGSLGKKPVLKGSVTKSHKMEKRRPMSFPTVTGAMRFGLSEKREPEKPKILPPAASAAQTEVQEKRKPGRPKKSTAAEDIAQAAVPEKRKPGRPKKSTAAEDIAQAAVPEKRKPGRPKKSTAAEDIAQAAVPEKRKPGRPKKSTAAGDSAQAALQEKRKPGRPKSRF
ncbi:MAG: SWIM zinc finger family protein [Vulcanimicrobiota bacterium]